MANFFRAVRWIIWLPFALLSNPGAFLVGCLLLGLLNPPQAVGDIFLLLVVMCVLFPVARTLKPPRQSGLKRPVGKPLIAALVRASQKLRYRSPGRSAFTRSLSPELRRLLKQPANQKPAAVRFEEAKVAGYHNVPSAGAS